MRRIGVFLVLALFLHAAPVALAKNAREKNAAKRLYAKKCGGACHRLYKPDEYTRDQWVRILTDMSRRAKLNADETKTIKAYLLERSTTESSNISE